MNRKALASLLIYFGSLGFGSAIVSGIMAPNLKWEAVSALLALGNLWNILRGARILAEENNGPK